MADRPATNDKQNWIIDLLTSTGMDVTGMLADDVTGLGEFFLDMASGPPGLAPMLAQSYGSLLNPEKWTGQVMRLVVEAAGVIGLVGAMTQVGARPGVQAINALMPMELPDVGSLSVARRWGNIDSIRYETTLAKMGYSTNASDLLYDTSTPKPGLGEILGSHIRRYGNRLTGARDTTGYAWADKWFASYVGATLQLPSLSDIVTLKHRTDMTATQYNELLQRINFDSDLVQWIPGFLDNVLGPMDIVRAGLLGGENAAWFTSELNRVQFDPHYNDMIDKLAFTYPSPSDFARYERRIGNSDLSDYDTYKTLGQPPGSMDFLSEMSWTIPGPGDVARYNHMKGKRFPTYNTDLSRVGLHPDYNELVDQVGLGRPSPAEWFAFAHRMERVSTVGPGAMTPLGYDSDYWNVWETLSHPMPGVQDLVMMAVREVFSPEIAERFGQFQEIPDAFIENAAKIGLSEYWATNYWGAHWTLPSVMHGFEMFHRGVLEQADLSSLFVALDIMPFWRDKLQAISHRLLTRVDVRRMYREGVLTYDDVLDAYTRLGYDPVDSVRMSNFTVAYVRRQEAGYSKSQVIGAYKDRVLSEDAARGMLGVLGVHGDDASFMLALADYDLETDLQNERIKIVESSYKKGLIDLDQAGVELDGLNVPPEQKQVLLTRWYVHRQSKPRVFTKSEIMRYLVNGSINFVLAAKYLDDIGYSPDKVSVMLSSASMERKNVHGQRRQLSIEDLGKMLKTAIITGKVFLALLDDYGYREPERSLIAYQVSAAAGVELPEGEISWDEKTVLSVLLHG